MLKVLLIDVALGAALITVAGLIVIRRWRRSSGHPPTPASSRGAGAERAGQTMAPRFPGGEVAKIVPDADRRIALADWLTRPDNPYFARSVANRVWFHLMGRGIVEEFNWVYMFLALVPFLFFRKMHRRERAWMIGIVAIYFFLGVLLLILLNPPPDKQAQQLIRVFFTASHTMISLLVGYGLTLVAAYMATHYERFRSWGLIGGSVAIALALFSFV